MISKNSASSRAIPTSKMIQRVRDDPAFPIHWGANVSGMSAREEVHEPMAAWGLWREALDSALRIAEEMREMSLHKQVVNRILEPFSYITVIASATDWDNFFALRDHPDAQPEMQMLAKMMKSAYNESTPKLRRPGEWHLPLIDEDDYFSTEEWPKVSAGRCARVSYLTHDGKRDWREDIKLYEKLTSSIPMHASPLEHPAVALDSSERTGNFTGWMQLRKIVEREKRVHP